MATKLYPPAIDNKLPAFAGRVLKVPFTHNRAVGFSQVGAMVAIIKTVQTNTIIADGLKGTYSYDDATGQYMASFQLGTLYSSTGEPRKITPGQFYKVQIAYESNESIPVTGYFSSVGVIKCTTAPTISIPNLDQNYYGSCEFTGYYSQEGAGKDSSEKVYSYQFFLRGPEGDIIATSGEQIHDSSNDQSTTTSYDAWSLNQVLEDGMPYYISYKVTTMNGLVAETQGYTITQTDMIDPSLPCKLVAIANQEDGCISLYLRPISSKAINGSFVLSRSSSENDYKTWDRIHTLSYKNLQLVPRDTATHPSEWGVNDFLIWEDFTTKQGIEYIYSIQAYNAKGLYSSRVLNTEELMDGSYEQNPDRLGNYHTVFSHSPIYMDFEDAYLFDGERQLRIRFNPKVTSFKSTRLESKMDTLGGKYPFIFRNGNVEYKEFPISGLLSLQGDPNERFLEGIQKNLYISRADAASTQNNYDLDSWLTGDNLRREREFKMAALAWLTDGNPKLFRSPMEGNFIVRLMNTSMTPNDTVGRMLHTFTSTAYEIADCNFENLKSYNFITSKLRDNRDLKVGQIRLDNIPSDFQIVNGMIALPDAYFANITEATPGTIIGLDFVDGTGTNEVEIGGTGCYYIPISKEKPLKYITLISNPNNKNTKSWDGAKLTFCYYDDAPTDNFSIISDLRVHDEVRQFIGTGYPDLEEDRERLNVISNITDIRTQVGKFHFIKVTKRPTWIIYKQSNGTYTLDDLGHDPLSGADWNKTIIYEVRNPSTGETQGWMYGTDKTIRQTAPDYRFSYNGSSIIDMKGNPNELDTFVCRVCNEMGKQELFFKKDENGNMVMDEGGEPILECPHTHARRNDIVQLPSTQGRIEGLKNIESVESIFLGTGVIVDAAFRIKEVEYSFEETDPDVKAARADYLYDKQEWESVLARGKKTGQTDAAYEAEILARRKDMEATYELYVQEIERALEDSGVIV